MIFSALYLAVRCLLGCLMVLTRRQTSKDSELLVLRHENANDEDDLGFAIETLGDPPVLTGRIWISAAGARKDRCAAVGIALGREHIGRGYGTDAMRIIVGYGFREMGLHRIQLGVASFNFAGIRAYQKAGFTEEGRHRESVLHDGRWYDSVLMSILDHEWAARRSPS